MAPLKAGEEAPDVPHKFPRTPHLANLGSATRDDLVLDPADASSLLNHDLLCEEKVDGANLGISFDRSGAARLQKRSHWVTAASESQFTKLDAWLDRHGPALHHALGTQHILFGEWMAARHSVAYDRLPGWLLAFDVLHIPSDTFLSCAARDSLLLGTGVPVVRPVCATRRFASVAELEQLLHASRSSYTLAAGGALEGLYIRALAPDGRLVARAKLVHPAFLQAITDGGSHWSSRSLVLNTVRPDVWGGDDAADQPNSQPATEAAASATFAADEAVEAPLAEGHVTSSVDHDATALLMAVLQGAALGASNDVGAGQPRRAAHVPAPVLPLVLHRGALCLVGRTVEDVAAALMDPVPQRARACRVARNGNQHHVTLLTPAELQALAVQGAAWSPAALLARALAEVDTHNWLSLGLGSCREGKQAGAAVAYFAVLAWPSAQRWRQDALGLRGRRDFHATLGFLPHDVHEGPSKGWPAVLPDAVASVARLGPATAQQRAAVLLLECLAVMAPAAAAGGGGGGPAAWTPGGDEAIARLLALSEGALDQDAATGGSLAGRANGGGGGGGGASRAPFVRACAQSLTAQMAGRRGELEECLRCANVALQLDASLSHPHALAAKCHFQAHRYQDALAAFTTALTTTAQAALVLDPPATAATASATGFARGPSAAPSPPALPARPPPSPVDQLRTAFAHLLDLPALHRGVAACRRALLPPATPGSSSSTGVKPDLDPDLPLRPPVPRPAAKGSAIPPPPPLPEWYTPEIDPRHRFSVPGVDVDGVVTDVGMMRNTSFVVAGQVLGSSTPKRREQILALAQLGVRLVLTLTEEEPLPAEWFAGSGVTNLLLPVPNYHPPSKAQMDEAMAAMEACVLAGTRVLVHCGGGKGRAGTVLACYLCKNGAEPLPLSSEGGAEDGGEAAMPQLAADRSVQLLRGLRPGSIETVEQQRFVGDYCKALWKQYDTASSQAAAPSEPAAAPEGASGAGWELGSAAGGEEGGLMPGGYPSTPHLPFSPHVADDDTQLGAAQCSKLLGTMCVLTEKLDGGNCCIHQGCVYARTHKHEAEHASFGTIKALARQIVHLVPAHIALFGENMTAVHSIPYDNLTSFFYLFGAFNTSRQEWLSWADVSSLADLLGLPTVPVLHQGVWQDLGAIEALMGRLIAQPSSVGTQAPREGFVVRSTAAIPLALFDRLVAKYVRKGHVQTDATWRKSWQHAKVVHAAPAHAPAVVEAPAAAAAAALPLVAPPAATGGAKAAVGAAAAATAGGSGSGAASGSQAGRKGARGGGGAQAAAAPGGGAAVRAAPASLPRVVVLVGLPGSGKSYFSQALLASSRRWVRVSQDDCGGQRGACELEWSNLMLKGLGPDQHAILDRCNVTAAERSDWLKLALISKRDKGVVAVHFDVPAAVCKERVAARRDHPTIPFGRGGPIVDSFAKKLQAPVVGEGFERVEVVQSFDQADALLRSWGARLTEAAQDAPPPVAPRVSSGASTSRR